MKLAHINMIEADLVCETGLHIGGSETGMHIGGTDTPVIKTLVNGKDEPYIPGSSLKGKIRSLLEILQGYEYDLSLTRLFGKKADDTENKNEILATRLSFWDCFMTPEWKKQVEEKSLPFTEVKMENTINRLDGKAQNPRNTERVYAGSVFNFKLSWKVFEGDDEDDYKTLILKGLKLLEKDSLGGSGSRGYGKVRFQGLKMNGQSIQEDFDKIKLF